MSDKALAWLLHRFILEKAEASNDVPPAKTEGHECWQGLRRLGTRLWLDSGDINGIAGVWDSAFEALTTNNTLLNREIQKGGYDGLVAEAAALVRSHRPDVGDEELALEAHFVLNACHGLRLSRRFNAMVSVELHTLLADNVEGSMHYARRYYALCPEMFYIKVPFTLSGLIIARHLGDAGIPVNLTLGFSARQNYLAASFARPAFVNVFMGRLNAFVKNAGIGNGANVGERATLLTQRELTALREARQTRTMLIGASMRDAAQVGALAGIDVMTIPLEVAAAFASCPGELNSGLHRDPRVVSDSNCLCTLWDVPNEFKSCVAAINRIRPDAVTVDAIREQLGIRGYGELFPDWTFGELERIRDDGKIPCYGHWSEKLEKRHIGLDALMSMAALQAFAVDQGELDRRIAEVAAVDNDG